MKANLVFLGSAMKSHQIQGRAWPKRVETHFENDARNCQGTESNGLDSKNRLRRRTGKDSARKEESKLAVFSADVMKRPPSRLAIAEGFGEAFHEVL